MAQLASGDILPSLTLNIGEDSTLTLPDDMETDYGVVLDTDGNVDLVSTREKRKLMNKSTATRS